MARITLSGTALTLVLSIPTTFMAQTPVRPAKVGTILVAHGADSAWNARVLALAKQVNTGGPVAVSFLMGDAAARSPFQSVVASLEAQGVSEIAVVPVLVSSFSGHADQIRYLAGDSVHLDGDMAMMLHMSGIERPTTKVPLRVTRAMDDAPEVARVIAEHALTLSKTPAHQALFIIGHGPNSAEDYAAWMKNLRVLADSVKARTGFQDVRVDVVRDDAPPAVRAEAVLRVRELIEMQHALTGHDVVVVPILVSAGAVSRVTVPQDLTGLPIVYSGEPLLPNAAMARWVESRVKPQIGTREPRP